MTSPKRRQLALPGALVVGVLSLGATWLSVSSFADDPTLTDVIGFALSVLSAPLFLLGECVKRGVDSFPTETLVLAIVAIGATPVHPLFPRAWTAALTVVGLLAWLVCELIVAGAPA